jgi:hypothetical protein
MFEPLTIINWVDSAPSLTAVGVAQALQSSSVIIEAAPILCFGIR